MILGASNCPTSVPWRYNPNKKSEISLVKSLIYNGARGRTRTGTELPPRDFKSLASTNFATRANSIAIACFLVL